MIELDNTGLSWQLKVEGVGQMTDQQIERYTALYGKTIESLVDTVAHMVAQRDTQGIQWLITAVATVMAVGGAHLRGKDLMN